ncbi:GIY-YIG nuclease family protein [Paenibacillus sp. MMO-177]|uniref:GIY-YIG nuclease family protein n=1 Tax=Paenibacillus sp. MMO-177 TaxID=3081289 RepID=UPI00301665E9
MISVLVNGEITEKIFVGDEKELQQFTGPGIYFLKDKSGGILYIGQAVNIWKRLKEHIDGSDDVTGKCVKYIHHIDIMYFLENTKQREALETLLIIEHLPPFNEKDTPEQGNLAKMKAKMDKYLKEVPEGYHINNWANYEKLSYINRECLELSVFMGAAEISWGIKPHLPNEWTWSVWRNVKDNYISEMQEKGKSYEELKIKAWEVINADYNSEKAFRELISITETTDSYMGKDSISRMKISKVNRSKRGSTETTETGFDSVNFHSAEDSRVNTEVEEKFAQLLENLQSEHKYTGVEVYHKVSVEKLKDTEIWPYILRNLQGRFFDTPLCRKDDASGEYILAIVTHDEWRELSFLAEDPLVTIDEREE